jgi:hypothetical protein
VLAGCEREQVLAATTKMKTAASLAAGRKDMPPL